MQRKHLIDPGRLDKKRYFESLVEEAYRAGILSDGDLQQIHQQSVMQLAKEVKRYTFGDSDSVPVDTAQSILESAYYKIGLYLQGLPSPEQAVESLQNKVIPELIEQGKSVVKQKKEQTAILMELVLKTAAVTSNVFYNDTVFSGLPIFFERYDMDFAAQETPGMIDYYLSRDAEGVGVEFMHGYLSNLLLENRFCRCFEPERIEALLKGYDAQYRESIINLFDHVLTNAIGCRLCGKPVRQLDIEETDRAILFECLTKLENSQRQEALQAAAKQVCAELALTDPALLEYAEAAAGKISVWVENALENTQLQSLFVSLCDPTGSATVEFQDGKKMTDEAFRTLVSNIEACEQTVDKLALIHATVHSFVDLEDLLGAGCLQGDECYQLFSGLGDIELAVLAGKTAIQPDQIHLTYAEKVWQDSLVSYLITIDPAREWKIELISKQLRFGL